MKRSHFSLLAGLATLSLLAIVPAHAQGTLIIGTPGGTRTDGPYDIGFKFTVGSSNVSVTSLGYYAVNTALAANHQVTIYSTLTGNAPIGTANVLAGTTLSADHFAYVAVTPFTLLADTSYLIGAPSTGDPFLDDSNGGGVYTIAPSSGIASLDSSQYNLTPGDAPTTSTGRSATAFVGPNFISQISQPAAAPEPSQTAGLGFAVLGVLGLLWKAKKRSASEPAVLETA